MIKHFDAVIGSGAGSAGAVLSIIKLNSRMTPMRGSGAALGAARGAAEHTASSAVRALLLTHSVSQSKRFNGDVDAYQEALDNARSAVLTTLTPERMRATYCTAFAPARERYTAVALKPKRTLLQRALEAQIAASAAWADASTTARGGAVLVAGAAGVLTVAVVYARWRAWRGT